jgi:PKD repeat protein
VAVTALQGEDEFAAGSWQVSVADVAPTITLDAPASSREQNPVDITFSASDAGDDTLTGWTVDWGDGSSLEPLAPDATGASHVYATGGQGHTITLTALDEDGSASETASVSILVGPVLSISGSASAIEGAAYQLTLSASEPGVITSWSIDWGDGTTSNAPGTATTVEHTFIGAAVRTVTATGTDSYGTWSANELQVTVTDVEPTVSVTVPESGKGGVPFDATLAYDIPGGGNPDSWTVNWGDGTPDEVLPGTAASASHLYPASGNYTIQVTATDPGGSYGDSAIAVINPNVRQGQFAVSASGESLTLTGRNSSGELWIRDMVGGGWGGWTRVGNGLASRPVPVRIGADLYVFHRGLAGDVRFWKRTGGIGGPWTVESLGGVIEGDPAVAVDGQGELMVVIHDAANKIWYRRTAGGAWQGWQLTEGLLKGSLVLERQGDDLHLLGLDSLDSAWTRQWSASSDTWGPWTYLNGVSGLGLGASTGPAGLVMFGFNAAGSPWHRTFANGSWGLWNAMPGVLVSPPALDGDAQGLLLAGVNKEGHLWVHPQTASGFTGWMFGGGILGTYAQPVKTPSGTYLFALSETGVTWYRFLGVNGWGPWTNLGGILAIE